MEESSKNEIVKSENDFDIRIQQLESEKKKMLDEFNMQRAKMKELFLQKEDELIRKNAANDELNKEIQQLRTELNDVKSQLVVAGLTLESNLEVEKRKAKEEIATLQQLVHETVEESSSSRTIYDTEVKKLQQQIQQLQNEIVELKNERQQSPHHLPQEQSSLVPSAMLSAVTKRLVKKLGADTFGSQDIVEDNMRKVDGEHAQEDAEVLRSLVVPLEEEIKALKDKLRSTDEQLQKYRQANVQNNDPELLKFVNTADLHQEPATDNEQQQDSVSTAATNTSFDSHRTALCDMCSNYEAQLVKEQHRTAQLEEKVAAAEKATERHREELLKEIGFRKDMEEKWNEKKEEHKQQIAELTKHTECAEQDLKEVQDTFRQACKEININLHTLTRERESVQQELIKLQNENDNLIGKYSVHSQQLQSEMINLPDSVEELQELLLKSHQDLIIAKLGKEAAEDTINNLKSDIMLLKDEISNEQQEKSSLFADIENMKKFKHQLEREKQIWASTKERLQENERTLEVTLADLQMKYNELLQAQEKLEKHNNELKTQIGSLQQELDTSETVQKDFVQLSQSLQIQLEKIRDSDIQVRWQHDEDIEECPSCKVPFSGRKTSKWHCCHCGTIFCASCLTHSVPSGPNMRPSKVCDVCHTLLVKSSAPYFSEAPPQN